MTSKYANNRTVEEQRAFWYNTENQRRCCTCKLHKETTEFHKDKSSFDGLGYACKACVSAYQKAHYSDKERYALKKKRDNNNYYMRQYGISKQQFVEELAAQGGGCLLCGLTTARMHQDHCHTSNKRRGILCSNCNRGLGHFMDNPELLRKAASYIETQKQEESAKVGP